LRLQAKVIKIVDISYGGENGFNQAIELAGECLANVKFIQEKKLIGKYFDEISLDTGRYCFGVEDTMKALEMGAIETLILWENLEVSRASLKDATSPNPVTKYLRPDQERENKWFLDANGAEMEVIENTPLIEWLANNYKTFGSTLEIITDWSQEGAQFCRGFGGIGGLLRYRVDFQAMDGTDFELIDADIDDYL
jgi:peptide chain release factor subunit 1